MGFVYEKIPEEDIEFLRSRGFKNCWGSNFQPISARFGFWSVNKGKEAYLIKIGGGMHEVPLIADLWWNGSIVRIEYDELGSIGTSRIGIEMVWNINRIIVPKNLWDKRDEVVDLVRQAFSVMYWSDKKEHTKSILVNINCQLTQAYKGDVYGD